MSIYTILLFINTIVLLYIFYWDSQNKCQLRDLNPRPFGIAPKATALDRSAKLTSINYLQLSPYKQSSLIIFTVILIIKKMISSM